MMAVRFEDIMLLSVQCLVLIIYYQTLCGLVFGLWLCI